VSEKSMARLVMDAIRHLDPVRVENPAHPGTPDVNYAGWTQDGIMRRQVWSEGWIELKELDEWPKRPGTIVRVERFTNEQRIWLERRWGKGGAAWLLLKVRQDWLLLTGAVGAKILGRAARLELEQGAEHIWHGSAYKMELARCLSRRAN